MTKAEFLDVIKDCSNETEIKLVDENGPYKCNYISLRTDVDKKELIIVLE